MSVVVVAQAGDVRDVNNTCNVLHVARSVLFASSGVLTQLDAIQTIIAAGAEVPEDLNKPYGGHSGVTWLGGESSDVMSCSWSKDIDGVVGMLSIQLKPRAEYLQLILPGDLLFVFMDDTGSYEPDKRFTGTLVSIVVVDRVAETRTVQSGATIELISITARDLAVVLSESSTVFDAAFANIEQALYTGEFIGKLFNDKKQLGLSPLENVLLLMLLLFDQETTGSVLANSQWKMSVDGEHNNFTTTQLVSLIDITTYAQNPLPFYALPEPPGILQAGNVWSLIESYSNPLMNEFFIDVRDNNQQEREFRAKTSAAAMERFYKDNSTDPDHQQQTVDLVRSSRLFRTDVAEGNDKTADTAPDGTSTVALVFRQRPYDAEAFFALPFNAVDSTEVESMEVARSSHDVFNWFRVRFPNIDVKLQEIVAGVAVAPLSIAKFGYRRMDAETRYMFASSSASTTFKASSTNKDFSDIFNQYMDLVATWYAQNEVFLAGTMTMRFNPRIRVGTRLLFTRGAEAFNYYVQSVQHNFQSTPGSSRTTLTITRGIDVVNATVPLAPTTKLSHKEFKINKGAQ